MQIQLNPWSAEIDPHHRIEFYPDSPVIVVHDDGLGEPNRLDGKVFYAELEDGRKLLYRADCPQFQTVAIIPEGALPLHTVPVVSGIRTVMPVCPETEFV